MKVARLVLGILSILWSLVVVVLMSFYTLIDFGVSFDALDEIIEEAYLAPLVILLGAFFLAGGIVMVACRKRAPLGGSIACAVIFGVGLVLSIVFGEGANIAAVTFIPLFVFSIVDILVTAIHKNKDKTQQSVQ